MRVLLVEDNLDLCASLFDYLENHKVRVTTAYSGKAGLEFAKQQEFDAIILDINLPGINGIKLCSMHRQELRLNTPIVMLTARSDLEDKLACFDNGADDYLVKPFEMAELMARLKALAKRKINSYGLLTVGDLIYDTQTLEITREGKAIKLNASCRKILAELMKHSPEVVSRQSLEHLLWDDEPPDADVLKIHIHNLRTQIDKPFSTTYLKTVRGTGYQLISNDNA